MDDASTHMALHHISTCLASNLAGEGKYIPSVMARRELCPSARVADSSMIAVAIWYTPSAASTCRRILSLCETLATSDQAQSQDTHSSDIGERLSCVGGVACAQLLWLPHALQLERASRVLWVTRFCSVNAQVKCCVKQ